jgi:hypothetical protein
VEFKIAHYLKTQFYYMKKLFKVIDPCRTHNIYNDSNCDPRLQIASQIVQLPGGAAAGTGY